MSQRPQKYGLFRFLFDLGFGILTSGIWWLFLLFRALRRK